jgi:hypothetical protein
LLVINFYKLIILIEIILKGVIMIGIGGFLRDGFGFFNERSGDFNVNKMIQEDG